MGDHSSGIRKWLTCLAFLLGTIAASADVRPLYLYAEHHGNHIKLLWSIRQWRDGITGVSIWRRDVPNGKWELIRKEISPGVIKDRDWAIVDPAGPAQERLKKLLETRLSSGAMNIVRPETYYERAAQAKPAQFLGQSIVYRSDYDKALLSGFACVDRNVSRDKAYEYGISFVMQGLAAAEPEAVVRAAAISLNDNAFCVVLSASPTNLGVISLKWKSPFTVKGFSIVGFRVYRKRLGVVEEFQSILRSPVGPVDAKDKVGSWQWLDHGVDTKKSIIYAVAPVTSFQTELRRSVVIYVPPVATTQAIFKALTADQPDMKTVKVGWTFREGIAGLYDRLTLERRDRDRMDAQYVCVSKDLPTKSTTYEDKVELKPELALEYRIRAFRDGKVVGEETAWFRAADKRVPAAPIGFTATYQEKGDRQLVVVGFKPVPDSPVQPKFYRLSVYHGTEAWALGEIAAGQVPKQGIRKEFELPVSGGKDVDIEVQAVRDWYKSKSVRAKLHVPALKLPEVRVKSVTDGPIADQRIVHWEYENVADLKGFRIFIDGKRVADESAVAPNARKWTSGPLTFDSEVKFRVEAVSTYGKLSMYNSGSAYRIGRPDRSKSNEDALGKAVAANDLQKVEHLLRMGTDPRHCYREFGVVETAMLAANKPMVDLLLSHGAKSSDLNPLFKAIFEDNVKAVKSAVASDPKLLASRFCGKQGLTPLMFAVRLGRTKQVPVLADASRKLINARARVLKPSGQTALHIAAARRDWSIVTLLLKHGADPDVATDDGSILLHFVAGDDKQNSLLESLLERKPTLVDARRSNLTYRDEGFTAMQIACKAGAIKNVRTLVGSGASVDGDYGFSPVITPLMHAADSGDLELVKYLVLKCDAYLQYEDFQKKTVLTRAIEGKHKAIAEFLKKHGAYP